MLHPPLATAVPQVPDTEVNKSSHWLEAFAAGAAHSALLSTMLLEASYRYGHDISKKIRALPVVPKLEDDFFGLDIYLQKLNSAILEDQLMSHDSSTAAMELFTHFHVLQRR